MPKIIPQNMLFAIIAIIFAASFLSCASNQERVRLNTEKMLEASGFKMGVADTPEKLAHLKKLPQRKVIPQGQGDNLYYVYADAEYCKCAFEGNEAAYEKYQKLTEKKHLDEEERREAARTRQQQRDWQDWSFDQAW